MATLTVTTRGQVTFRKAVLNQLGIKPGGKIELEMPPNGAIALRAARQAGTIEAFLWVLAGKTSKAATLGEINEAAAGGWAGLAMLAAGGDFADGVIAHEGRWLGGEILVSFDRAVVGRLEASAQAARLLD